MKTKRTLIISSLIMCLTLIVAVVSITAAWFGDVNQSKLGADLTINSGTVSSSADIDMSSDISSDDAIFPAVAVPGKFLKDSVSVPHGTPTGEPPVGEPQPAPNEAELLYPSREGYDKNALNIKEDAKVVTFYLTVEYVGVQDDGATDGKKSLQMELEGVYLSAEMAKLGEEEQYNAHNYRNEFNVKMSLVDGVEGDVITSETDSYPLTGKKVYYNNNYDELNNKYGHIMQMRVAPGKHVVKFEIYFNKVDEECNFDLLNTQLTLRVTLSQEVNLVAARG